MRKMNKWKQLKGKREENRKRVGDNESIWETRRSRSRYRHGRERANVSRESSWKRQGSRGIEEMSSTKEGGRNRSERRNSSMVIRPDETT